MKPAIVGLGLLGALAACGPSTPFAPVYMRPAAGNQIEVGLLPCGSGQPHITRLRVVTLDKDARQQDVVYEAAAETSATTLFLPRGDLASKVGDRRVVRLIVSIDAAGEVSMPFSLSDFGNPNTVRVHDRNVRSREFADPVKWCDGVAPIS